MHPKDKIAKDQKTGMVYQIKCADCEASYVGETERNVKKRMSEHQRSASPVGHHMDYRKHSFSCDNVSVLHQEAGWFHRGVTEAIHITRTDPMLNRDQGLHTRPNINHEVIKSCDSSQTVGSHDHATLQ